MPKASLSKADLIAAILSMRTLDDSYSAESLEALGYQELSHTLASMKRIFAQAKADYEEDEERRSRMMPSWAVSDPGPDPRDAAW